MNFLHSFMYVFTKALKCLTNIPFGIKSKHQSFIASRNQLVCLDLNEPFPEPIKQLQNPGVIAAH
ncbi:hypothetical protein SIID45300_00415 [Candidatus Magnetaquicoccaceae bacterium FCR-1]|uniref:Uncharacterized protein n=1 Tax=Candidatus Magnetaquiglobus chichijimensis TaxID=3141448 RepID=A0ABQ0C5E2_9PROT